MSIINFKKHCIWTTYVKNYVTKNLSMQSQHYVKQKQSLGLKNGAINSK